MFDSVILLTGPTEGPVLTAALKGHRPDLDVLPIASLEDLRRVDSDRLARSRLIAFASPIIVPAAVLCGLGYGAINFHPGPPEYPGFCPAQFAIYEGARRFGATAHFMVERVDEGPIFDVVTFDLTEGTSVLALEMRSYRQLAWLFWRNAGRLAREEKLPEVLPLRWSGKKSSRARYRQLTTLTPEVDAAELSRRIRAFGGNYFGMPLTLSLHGASFAYVGPAAT